MAKKDDPQEFVLKDERLKANWIPVYLPKDVVARLIQNYIPEEKRKDLATMSKREIMDKLHKTRRDILRDTPYEYIETNS